MKNERYLSHRRNGATHHAWLLMWLFACLVMPFFEAQALESEWQGDPDIAEVRLLSAVKASGDLATLPMALEFRIAPGWKMYWRTPGEAGLPPSIDLASSPTPNLYSEIRWPLPKRFDVFGFDNYGYETHVVLPVNVSGHIPASAVQIDAAIDALACSDICVPIQAQLTMSIPDGAAVASNNAQMIAQFAAQIPRLVMAQTGRAASGPNLGLAAVWIDSGEVIVELEAGAPPIDDIFIEGFDGVAFKAPIDEGGRYRIPVALAKGTQFSGGQAVLTIAGGGEMAEFKTAIAAENSRAAPSGNLPVVSNAGASLFLLTLGIAFIGGLILNLMPCVLPVLALKLSAVLGLAGRGRTQLRFGFLAGAAGIVTSFLLLASALVLVRAAGGQIGWGIQFQNPIFLGVMMLLLGLFALNLLDFVNIPVPRFASNLSGRLRFKSHGLAGDFLAGMLATILATPCSAPFVGTAVTFALSGSNLSLFAIFLAMGIGLASPWIVVAIFPGMITILPRPGHWMIWMKRGLALLLAGTIFWLGSILINVTGTNDGQANMAQISADDQQLIWQPFNPEAISGLVADGKIVLVDVTADWCITCKANKLLVLDRAPLAGRLAGLQAAGDLVAMQADWTRPDARIAAFLASHDRFGIPFDIIYGTQGPDGVILPELLTSGAVIEALETVQKLRN